MWKKGQKRKDDGESAGGDEEGPRWKKAAKESADDDDDGSVVCELSKNRRVSVRSFAGKIMVDIREFYTKDGKTLPGKKGISLTMDQWNILREHIDEIDKAVNENA